MNAGLHELADNRERPLACAGEVLEACAGAIEDGLGRERVVLVDVEERLVIRIVREQQRLDRQDAGRPGERSREAQLQRLPRRHDLDVA
jgi:hypothetical protein